MIQSSIYGRLGRDPKASSTKNGKPMCTASVAVDVGQEQGQETLWVTLMAFGHQAEALQRHQQGDMVAAMGKLTRGKYAGNDGQERESWSLLVDALHSSRAVRPGGKRNGQEKPKAQQNGGQGQRQEWTQAYGEPGFDDDIAF
jgi:single-strand DNA-binding protein